jgi:hypothetical protein
MLRIFSFLEKAPSLKMKIDSSKADAESVLRRVRSRLDLFLRREE